MVERYPDWENLRTLWHSARSAVGREGLETQVKAPWRFVIVSALASRPQFPDRGWEYVLALQTDGLNRAEKASPGFGKSSNGFAPSQPGARRSAHDDSLDSRPGPLGLAEAQAPMPPSTTSTAPWT